MLYVKSFSKKKFIYFYCIYSLIKQEQYMAQ